MNLACIGTGKIVEAFLTACLKNDDIKLYSVYSRTIESGLKIVNKFHIPHLHTDLSKLLDDENLDVVYIASPNSLHYEQCVQCITAKKHVIVEKPFTTNLKEAEDIFLQAEINSVFVFEAMSLRFLPNLRLLKKKLSEIGDINWVEATCISLSSRYAELQNGHLPNIFNVAFSGGALMDLNVYNLTFVYELFGNPKKFDYLCHKHKNGTDLSGVLTLKYADFIAICVATKNTNGKRSATIYGSKGNVEIESGVNGLKGFELIKNGESEYFNIQNEEMHFIYGIKDIVNIIKNFEVDKYNKLRKHTLDIMKILTIARYKANLIFENDLL